MAINAQPDGSMIGGNLHFEGEEGAAEAFVANVFKDGVEFCDSIFESIPVF